MKSRYFSRILLVVAPSLWRRFYLGAPVPRPYRIPGFRYGSFPHKYVTPWCLAYDFRVRSCATKCFFVDEKRFFPYGVGYVLKRPGDWFSPKYPGDDFPF